MVGNVCIHFRNIIKPDFFLVTGRKLICRNMDHVVCTAGDAAGNSALRLSSSFQFTVSLTLIPLITILSCVSETKGFVFLGAVMFIIYQVGRMSIIMYLPCMVLGSLTGISVNVLIIVMGGKCNYLLLYRRIKIRTLDRLYSGIGTFGWSYVCIGISSGTH